MKLTLIQLLRYIHHFGFIRGLMIFNSLYVRKKGKATVRIPGVKKPVYLRRATSDIKAFEQVFLDKGYNYPFEFEVKTIIDCGANVGLASVFFINKYSKAKIIALEPEKGNFDIAKQNVLQYPDITILQNGVWHKNAFLEINDRFKTGNWGFICTETETPGASGVQAVSINEIMKTYKIDEIDILKIDIEGSEMEVFSQGYETWLPKTKAIMLEIHDCIRKGSSRSVFSALLQYDFSVYHIDETLVCIRNN